ncbi:hypothetical protein BCV69DRAFT_961 [Microstroma glucosiphilum]|uniref:Uncharacterized protein n=1 Tax=Pseudomicrostroma glucosiphilum TaxID=1684307 RepID=A0A316UHV5_9BASI|nr:hypothetical protein BCV69DRAFT_961 [Pseudomicrostroma glucosiphilum]PWN23513.1 hypothetical protein BCV69DRAFT_961 [Pseudomicrostroma glucosiphilum]
MIRALLDACDRRCRRRRRQHALPPPLLLLPHRDRRNMLALCRCDRHRVDLHRRRQSRVERHQMRHVLVQCHLLVHEDPPGRGLTCTEPELCRQLLRLDVFCLDEEQRHFHQLEVYIGDPLKGMPTGLPRGAHPHVIAPSGLKPQAAHQPGGQRRARLLADEEVDPPGATLTLLEGLSCQRQFVPADVVDLCRKERTSLAGRLVNPAIHPGLQVADADDRASALLVLMDDQTGELLKKGAS